MTDKFEYKFWVSDFDRTGKSAKEYPQVSKIFNYPYAFWFGWKKGKEKIKGLKERIDRLINRAHPAVPVMVIYNLPDRDIGQHSKGGALTTDEYLEYITIFANAIGNRSPIVVYEPDGLPHSTLQEPEQAQARLNLMKQAVDILTTHSESIVYIDVGHSNWLPPKKAAELLNTVTNPAVRGFAVNISNFRTTAESLNWGLKISELTQSKHFIIDTSRNGNGPHGNDWCNPPGRALGTPATVDTGHELCDAFMWIKVPGESDGYCNGGPKAGTLWREYAKELVENTEWLKD